MKVTTILLAAIGFTILMRVFVNCSAAERAAIRTVDDIAVAACEAAFGDQPAQPGVNLHEFCQVAENSKPFVDSILGAKRRVALRYHAPPARDGGAG